MERRVLGPWSAAALPEIMAGALQESKLEVPVLFHEGRAAGKQPSSAAGARGGGTAEAKVRPNVEVNRRAEGTSELNRRLGTAEKGAAALERCGIAEDYGRGLAGTQARRACSFPRRPSSRPATEALPEYVEEERQKPERGLTLRLTGVPKARPS